MKDKIYLGDGVYAGQDGYHIWVWTENGTENGIDLSHPIALEPAVLDALADYRTSLLRRANKGETDG